MPKENLRRVGRVLKAHLELKDGQAFQVLYIIKLIFRKNNDIFKGDPGPIGAHGEKGI